ncbi:hypothetical protein LAV79_26680 [Peribacillus butanolivorans]|uniref:hypothetical protein n=1 Tax=Peribacillus butanolivorans TaxID=421767 RepID=UPI0030C90E35
MYIIIAFLVFVIVFIATTQLISNRYWKCIYTTFGYENYFKVVAKLKSEGITYKTKTPINIGSENLQNRMDSTQYDVFVKNEDEQKAQKALHKNN